MLYGWDEGTDRPMPWLREKQPYRIWLSEIMLQQTSVTHAIGKYQEFIARFPDIHSLAQAREKTVLAMWSGLGYNRRALHLHRTAKIISRKCNGDFPNSYNELLALPGIGPYTAAALMSLAFGEVRPVVDTNVRRVISRIYGKIETKEIQITAEFLIDPDQPAKYNQAIMNFGALVCTAKNAKCSYCPFSGSCHAHLQQMVDRLPPKTPKNPRKKRYFHFLDLGNDDRVILIKRNEKDIWPGMYSLPYLETNKKGGLPIQEIMNQMDIPKSEVELRRVKRVFRQTLTHQIISAHFYQLDSVGDLFKNSDSHHLVKRKNLMKFALPGIIRQYFKHLNK